METINGVQAAVNILGGPKRTALIVGVSGTAVQNWLRAGRMLTIRHAVHLARLTGVPLADLCGDGGLEEDDRRHAAVGG